VYNCYMINPLHTISGLVGVLTGADKSSKNKREQILKTLKARANQKRNIYQRIADTLTASFGSFTFLALNVLFFISWIYLNTSKHFAHFDPYPFNFLTMSVSLEAIVLSIFVLMSQNSSSKVDDVREELHLQINLIAEKEITKALSLIVKIAEKQGIDVRSDKELAGFLAPLQETRLEVNISNEMR